MPPVFDSWLQAWSRQALAVAARLRWPLNLGDCFAYALAIREESPILTLDEDFLRVFEEKSDVVMSLERKVTTEVIQRSMKIKAEVVARDERETLGERVLLNYGHTIGHAIEAATGYHRILHGEAISIGMMGAAFISNELGLLSDSEVERQRVVLEAFNLPVSLDGIDVLAVKEAMSADKKTEDGAIRWVLLDGIGHAVTRDDVSPELVERALASVCK